MTNLMNEMIHEAADKAKTVGYGFAHRDTDAGSVKCRVLMVNTNSMNGAQKIWYLNDKRISAAKLAAI